MAWTAEQKAEYMRRIDAGEGQAVAKEIQKTSDPLKTTDGTFKSQSDLDKYEKSVKSGTPDKSLVVDRPSYAQVSAPSPSLGKGAAAAGSQAELENDTRLANDAGFRTSELARAKEVIANRKAQGLDTSLQENYIRKIEALNAGQSVGYAEGDAYFDAITQRAPGATENVAPSGESTPAMQQILDLIIQNQRDQAEALTAAEEARFKQQEAALNKAYAQAEADAEIARTQAEANLVSQEALIDENRYAESERGRVSAAQRGIGNSAQFQALERGTLSRAGQQKLEAAQLRDQQLSDIMTRINNLSLQRDLDVASARAQSDYNVATGEAALASQAFQQQLGQLQTGEERDFQRELLASQQGFQTSEREAAQEFQSGEAQLSRDFQAALTQAGFNHDITMFDKQSNLQKYLKAQDQAFQAAEFDRQRAAQKEDEAYNYALNLQREINSYTEGTPEYDAVQGAIQLEMDNLNRQKTIDFEWAQRYAEMEAEAAKAAYEQDLQRQFNAEFGVGMEGMIAQRAYENQMERFEDEQMAQIRAQFTGDAIAEAAQAAYAPADLPFIQEQAMAFNETMARLISPKAFGIEENVVDYLRDIGAIRMTEGQEAQINFVNFLEDFGVKLDKSVRDQLTGGK